VEVGMNVLKLTTVGNSAGVILPKEILERLRVKRGDSLYAIETKNGIELTAYNPEFAKQVEVAERVMRKDRDALRKLASDFSLELSDSSHHQAR
jgi:putative addiction module antidote